MLFKFAVATYLLLYISALFWGLFTDIELTLVSSESASKNSHKQNWFGLPMLVVASIGFGVQMPYMVPHLQHLFRVFVEGFSRFRDVSSKIFLIFCAFFLTWAWLPR
jgi:hypothetical protein